jgi:hypothetical protein
VSCALLACKSVKALVLHVIHVKTKDLSQENNAKNDKGEQCTQKRMISKNKGAHAERPIYFKDSKIEGVDVAFGGNSIWNGMRPLRVAGDRQVLDKF